MTDHATIFEMSPRDGLQNESRLIGTADKVRLVDLLSECGFKKIETASFVSPKWVPQMADAAEVMAGISRREGVAYTALTPNMKGFERAIVAKADEVAIFASASEGFSQRNINCTIAESLERFKPVVDTAASAGIPVRGYVSCITDCPFDGPIKPGKAALVAHELKAMGCYEISLGDTIGHSTPVTIAAMLDAVLEVVPAHNLAGHYHDTKGHALDNIAVSLDKGLRVFDSSVAGLGGCPFAPGAQGNVATESVVAFLEDQGIETGIDSSKLATASEFAATLRSPS